jgi:hypothetical protein
MLDYPQVAADVLEAVTAKGMPCSLIGTRDAESGALSYRVKVRTEAADLNMLNRIAEARGLRVSSSRDWTEFFPHKKTPPPPRRLAPE